jgi:hypothetical protein
MTAFDFSLSIDYNRNCRNIAGSKMNRLTRSILEQNLPPVFTQETVKSLEPDDNVRYC